MRTRAAKSAAPKTAAEESEVSPARLEASVTTPPRLFILPKDISPEALVVTLPHPATAAPSRYYFCPEKGVYEFTKVAAPKSTPRSWLLAPNRSSNATDEQTQAELSLSNGYVTKDADLLITTLIDPLFLVLPALTPATSKESQKQLFLSLDDHLDSLTEASRGLRHVLRDAKLRERVEQRIGVVCDTVDAGDETMYRLSLEKLLTELLMKAERMVVNGLPPSMEDRFVRRALDVPVMNVKREESTLSNASVFEDVAETPIDDEGSQTPSASTIDSHVSTDSGNTVSTAATSFTPEPHIAPKVEIPPMNALEGVPHLLRLRTAVGFLTSSYIPATLRPLVHNFMASSASPVDFAPLDKHLSYLASLRSQAAVLRSLSDNISRKRSAVEDDKAAEARAEKKWKKEEEEKRKKSESLGIKKLRKVDTSGMKKMSAFFTKAPLKK
ncbi:ribonuclease H2, subunit B [Cryomyces antarcticus]